MREYETACLAGPPDERGASRETSRTFQKGKINCSYEEEPGGGLNIPGENWGSLVKQVASTSHGSDLMNHDPITTNLCTNRESYTPVMISKESLTNSSNTNTNEAVMSKGSLTNSSNTSTNEEPCTLKMTPEELCGLRMAPEPHTLRVITSEVVITISCTQYSLPPPSFPSPDMKNTLITARVKFSDQHGARSRGAQAGVRLGGEQAEVRPGPLSQQHGIAAPHHDINRADELVPTEPDLVFPTITTRPLLHLLVISEDLATTQKMQ